MRIAVVDNEEKEIQRYHELIQKYEEETAEKNRVFYFSSGFDLLENFPADLDCIFLDIDMPQLNGLETAHKIREKDEDVILIFVTNLPQFAIDGYKVQALDFLLKPFKYVDLKVELSKVKRFTMKTKAESSLWISLKGESRKVDCSDITYIEIIHHDVIIHQNKGEDLRFRGSLSAIEEKLSTSSFVRIGSPFIVNLKYVEGISKNECLLFNGKFLPIGRQYKQNLLAKLNAYLNRDLGEL